MKRKKSKIDDKMLGIMIGIALTISAIGVINAASVSFAHESENSIMNGMMSGNGMSMMHSMMMGDNGGMSMMECTKMMRRSADDGEITQEEMEEMMQQMDKDGDGQCDYCGMSVEMCRRMMS